MSPPPPAPALADTAGATWRAAIKTAGGGPAVALISSFIALGALMSDTGFSLMQAILFSMVSFALPGQLAAAELYAHGTTIISISITVWLVNARLLPMTIVLLPLLRAPQETTRHRRWRDVLTAHLVAITCWVCFLASYHTVAPAQRRRYFLIIAGLMWIFASLATALGFYIGNQLPRPWLIGLLFLNPTYFLCLMLMSLTKKSHIAAFAGGMALLPLLHRLSPEWDIVLCGLIAGGLSFFLYEYRRHP